jgi:enamine deaminase RidA (YjgF/YER057c/UK114 family)
MSTVYDRLGDLGLTIPPLSTRRRAFVPVKRIGDLLYVSGQTPMHNGVLSVTGLVGGDEVNVERACEAARQATLNALAVLDSEPGGLPAITDVVRLTVYVASAPGFYRQPLVADAASELLVSVFGRLGEHARSAIGVAVLPGNAPLEVELIAAARKSPS